MSSSEKAGYMCYNLQSPVWLNRRNLPVSPLKSKSTQSVIALRNSSFKNWCDIDSLYPKMVLGEPSLWQPCVPFQMHACADTSLPFPKSLDLCCSAHLTPRSFCCSLAFSLPLEVFASLLSESNGSRNESVREGYWLLTQTEWPLW